MEEIIIHNKYFLLKVNKNLNKLYLSDSKLTKWK